VGTIYSGVGLISGLDYQSLVDQLMAIEARPRDQLLTRVAGINAQRTAYLEISARISALLSRVQVLGQTNTFRAATASSSLPEVLSATASAGARPGTYSFVVQALASTHQFVSRGFSDRTTPLSPGTLTIESAAAQVNNDTRLEEFNGHTGVRRGSFKIINSAGQEAVVNLSNVLTVGEVLEKINAAGIQVTASVRGDGLVLTDASGGSGGLRVLEVSGGHTAADLGFGAGYSYSTSGELVGRTVMYLAGSTRVATLNDQLGIRRSVAGTDFSIEAGGKSFGVEMNDTLTHNTRLQRLNHGQGVRLGRIRITSRDGTIATVDLSAAQNINDVKQTLEAAFGDSRITITLTGSRLVISDKTKVDGLEPEQQSPLIIEDLTGYAARDLGINGKSAGGKIDGRNILHMDTLADVLAAVTYAVGNQDDTGNPIVVASIATGGQGLEFHTASGSIVLTGPSGDDPRSKALLDLGFQEGVYEDTGGGAVVTGKRILGSIDTVLLKTLNGGAGVTGTSMIIQANGKTAELDLSDALTLGDVIDRINRATDSGGGGLLGIEATYDATGTRLVVHNLVDETPITISGDFADGIGLAQTGSSIQSHNLQRQYVSEATLLRELNAGRGISRGKLKITASNYASGTVDLTSPSIQNVRDVIEAINKLQIGVTARVNDTGDGLLITDTAGGAGRMKIEEDGGTVAHSLNILGQANDNGQIDGSFEFKLEIGGSDTLESLATRISSETTLATATVLNDGTGMAPYRLSIASLVSGAAGALILDEGLSGLGITTLTSAQDARMLFGTGGQTGILLTSSSNTFDNVVDGLTLTASGVDDDPVTITVSRELTTLTTALKGMVDDFNSAMDRVRQAGAYNATKEELGVLQGEGTLYTIQSRLFRMFTGAMGTGGTFKRLADLGIKTESGNRLQFDEEKFRRAYETDPEGVERFFTEASVGVSSQLKDEIEKITSTDGLIPQRTGALQNRADLLQDRVEQLNDLLERKRARLLHEFQAMESALSQMQAQQATLSSLATLADNYGQYLYGNQS
jgi:flagellar hook-associated protein 2